MNVKTEPVKREREKEKIITLWVMGPEHRISLFHKNIFNA